MSKAILALDVDGPYNPYGGSNSIRERAGYRRYFMAPAGWADARALRVWLKHSHGEETLKLAAEADLDLVWATTWEDEANRLIGPKIGLPELPVIKFRGSLEWKFPDVLKYAEGRPLAWFDDDFQLFPEARDAFLKARGDLPTLLHTVSPRFGLTTEDFAAVKEWATNL